MRCIRIYGPSESAAEPRHYMALIFEPILQRRCGYLATQILMSVVESARRRAVRACDACRSKRLK